MNLSTARNRFRLLVCAAAALAGACLVAGCNRPDPELRQGYIEGEFVYVASPLAGTLEKLSVQQGTVVKAGDALFALENASEKAARDEAERRRAQARANLDDVKKGRRPSEIEASRAQLREAQSALDLAQKDLARQEQLARTPGATTAQEIDRARSARDQHRHRVDALEAELKTARLGSRSDQIVAAEANLRAQEAALARVETDLARKRQFAPQAGTIFETLYREGEWVAAGRPVISLLPLHNVKLRVFVPEVWLNSIHVGDSLQVRVDGAGEPVAGKVSFISPRAEFTPPVIYSRENRSKFVFLVEARFEPAVAARLHPGQPVDVKFDRSAKK